MTLVGKILTMLIFIMSLVFMSFAVMVVATHTNWKEKALALKAEVADKESTVNGLNVQINELKKTVELERGSRVSALAALESKLVHAEDQLRQGEEALAKLRATHGQAVQTLDATQTRLASLVAEVNTLRTEIRDTQKERDEMFATVVQLTDQAHDLAGKHDQLTEKHARLQTQNANMKRVMNALGVTEHTDVSHIPPAVDGVVLAIGQKGLIEISLGTDDGLLKGHFLEVFRNNTYLGRVVVRKAAPDRSVAEIIPEYRKGIIKVNDRVATKVS